MHQCIAGTFPVSISPGETYWALAQRYNTTPGAIAAANPGVDPNRLYVGQTICVPGFPYPIPPGGCLTGLVPYVVQPGDTIWSIAQSRGTGVGIILQYNPVDPYDLRVGQVLCVP